MKNDDEFKRIALHQLIEKDRQMITKYEEGMAHYHQRIETSQYEIGRLDERLG
ncbi:hypothetical protein [Phytohabitans rumicis]|uniref:hypothetical protein n=1 Tax=Phytohabitans rumicis TaxID=1076125 RepID=UPI0015672445|nr:hypothetical protein [Phytohabitans rumicis]